MDLRSARIVYFGTPCAFSAAPLEALIAAGHQVVGVVVPPAVADRPVVEWLQPAGAGRVRPLPLLGQRGLLETAWTVGAAVLQVRGLRQPAAVEAIAALRPELAVVACFPRRIPPTILTLPTLGTLNVHPSLLPANRGPAPMFWTFRHNDRETGVTIHLVDEGLDTGPIILQERVAVPEGVWGDELERRLASLGGTLVARAVSLVAAGEARPQPQPTGGASYYPAPSEVDLLVPLDRPARAVFDFVRGAAGLGYELTVETAKGLRRVFDAVGYKTDDDVLDLPLVQVHLPAAPAAERLVACAAGTVRLIVAD